MRFDDLTPELQEKAKACKTPQEIIALTQGAGVELAEDQFDAVSGGES